MDVKGAVKAAKDYLKEVFSDEGLSNLGLEEIEHHGIWNVTLGFSRPWNTTRNAITALTGDVAAKRSYKIVKVREADGEVLSIRNRDTED